MSEPNDLDALQARLRDLRAQLTPRLELLRERGVELGPLLEDFDRLEALLEGRGEPGFNAQSFTERVKEVMAQVDQTQHLHEQAEKVAAVMELPNAVEQIKQMAAALRAHGGAGELRTAAELEAQAAEAQRALERGEVPAEAMEDAVLAMTAQWAEVQRRTVFRSAAMALYWEKQTPEWWAKLPADSRAQLEDILASWREEREGVLSELPLEDRRRLEAMSLEDFERPGAFDV